MYLKTMQKSYVGIIGNEYFYISSCNIQLETKEQTEDSVVIIYRDKEEKYDLQQTLDKLIEKLAEKNMSWFVDIKDCLIEKEKDEKTIKYRHNFV